MHCIVNSQTAIEKYEKKTTVEQQMQVNKERKTVRKIKEKRSKQQATDTETHERNTIRHREVKDN